MQIPSSAVKQQRPPALADGQGAPFRVMNETA